MTFTTDNLDVIAALSEWAMADSMRELQSQDRLTIGLRKAMEYGAPVDELSAITGLTPGEIRRRVQGPLFVLSELDALAGVA